MIKDIAILDDDPLTLKTLGGLLQKRFENKIKLFFFEDPTEFVHLCRVGAKFDLLITDYMMPNLSGVDVLKQTADSYTHGIVVSAKGDEFTSDKFFENWAMFSKPLAFSLVQNYIEACLWAEQ
jgi:DNA-binding response OmpR family regulator